MDDLLGSILNKMDKPPSASDQQKKAMKSNNNKSLCFGTLFWSFVSDVIFLKFLDSFDKIAIFYHYQCFLAFSH